MIPFAALGWMGGPNMAKIPAPSVSECLVTLGARMYRSGVFKIKMKEIEIEIKKINIEINGLILRSTSMMGQ